jgi:hypothetical protein
LKTLAAVLTLTAATGAWAQPARVTLVPYGDEAQVQAFSASLRELLERLEVTLDTGAADAGEEPALAAVEADFTQAGECSLTVVDARGRTVMTRKLDAVGSPAMLAEAAAHVVQSVIDDLKHPLVVRAPLPPPPQVEAPPPPPAKPEGRVALELGAFFSGRELGLPSAGGGASVSINVRLGPVRPALTLLLDYQAPVEVTTQTVRLSVQSFSPRLLLSLDVLRSDSVRLDAGLGGGADVFFAAAGTTFPSPPRVTPFASPVLSAMLRAHIAVASSADLYLALALDADLQPPNFVERDIMMTSSVFAPWRFRPSVLLGFTFDVLGPAPYARGAL